MTLKDVLEALAKVPQELHGKEYVGCFAQAPTELGLLIRPIPGGESVAYVFGGEVGDAWELLMLPADTGE